MERYVSFVREWSKDHGLSYMCAVSDPRLKADYAKFKKTGVMPKKSGRASKYQTKEEARRANIAKTNERKRMKKMIQMGAPERIVEGEGLFDRGNQMPPSARDYLKKNGDLTITSIRIERIPLGSLQKNLTAIVYVRELLTKFKKPENIPQDDLFHLQLVLTLSNGRRVMWSKEEVVKLSEKIYTGDKMESRQLGKTNIKLQDFVDNTAKYMGAKFAPYNAFDNNCQDFVMASLKSNGLGTQADYDFVKQDTKDLFKGRQWLIDMLKGATDLASAFNVLWEGKGATASMMAPPPAPAPPSAGSKVYNNPDLMNKIAEFIITPPPRSPKKGGSRKTFIK